MKREKTLEEEFFTEETDRLPTIRLPKRLLTAVDKERAGLDATWVKLITVLLKKFLKERGVKYAEKE